MWVKFRVLGIKCRSNFYKFVLIRQPVIIYINKQMTEHAHIRTYDTHTNTPRPALQCIINYTYIVLNYFQSIALSSSGAGHACTLPKRIITYNILKRSANDYY